MANVKEMATGEMTVAYETTTYDIRAENGHRLLTCVKSGSTISLHGKGGNIDINGFLEQVYNPSKARMKKTG